MMVKESYKHGWTFDILFGLCFVVVIVYEFTCNHKGKLVFVTCLKEGTQTNAATLRDLSLNILWRVINLNVLVF